LPVNREKLLFQWAGGVIRHAGPFVARLLSVPGRRAHYARLRDTGTASPRSSAPGRQHSVETTACLAWLNSDQAGAPALVLASHLEPDSGFVMRDRLSPVCYRCPAGGRIMRVSAIRARPLLGPRPPVDSTPWKRQRALPGSTLTWQAPPRTASRALRAPRAMAAGFPFRVGHSSRAMAAGFPFRVGHSALLTARNPTRTRAYWSRNSSSVDTQELHARKMRHLL
jgi:hypothetical protein